MSIIILLLFGPIVAMAGIKLALEMGGSSRNRGRGRRRRRW